MNRLILVAVLAAAFVLGACAGTPGAGGTAGTGGSPGAPAGDAALDALCGTGDASIDSLANELAALDDTSDVTSVNASIGTVMENLQDVEVSADVAAARDAVVTALQALQTSINDPATRQATAQEAAAALRSLDAQLCV